MLDFETAPRRLSSSMPMDFATYLLSASPPASNFELFSRAFTENGSSINWHPPQTQNRSYIDNDISKPEENIDNTESNINLNNEDKISALKNYRKAIKPIIIKKEEWNSDGEQSDLSSSGPTSPCSPGKSMKKVSFADHRGFALATVKIMTEASDQPPRLGREIINNITKGAKAEVTGLPPYKLKFPQPASDYMAFRDRVEKCCISLENVILRDYKVIGTVKVKNICFDKRVFLHCTFNGWKSSQDFEAKFVPTHGPPSNSSVDTFSFEFDIATETETNRDVEFAICFQTPAEQYWDNNSGENYHITPTDFNHPEVHLNQLPMGSDQSLNRVESWSEYASWHHVDTSCPYY